MLDSSVATDVNDTSDPVYVKVASDLLVAGLTLNRLVKINNNMLSDRFQSEMNHLEKIKPKGYHMNIQTLYHGTAVPYDLICDEGLDERLSRRGRFGKGIYFSDNPKKCCKYAESNKNQKPYLLCCKVILGDIKEYPDGEADSSLIREPLKQVVDGKRVYYDSIKGKPSNHTEYIIYEKRRVLIEYIAFYTSPSLERDISRLSQNASISDFGHQSSSSTTHSTRNRDSGSPASRSRSRSRSRSPIEEDNNSNSGSDFDENGETSASCPSSSSSKKPAAAAATTASAAQPSKSIPVTSRLQTVHPSHIEKEQIAALKQLLALQGVIPEKDMDELVRSYTTTYGNVPSLMSTMQSTRDEDPGMVVVQDDDPVSEVINNQIAEFMTWTNCDDVQVCRQYIELHNMNLHAAINAYLDAESTMS